MRDEVLPRMRRLQAACRKAGIEVMYTTIESLTKDGRDRSLDYKITGFNVPKGAWDGKVVDEIAPGEDEIVLPKSSSSVFVSTHIDYILRNLGVQQLVLSGVLTDQCVESAIRDACDLGYLVTQVTDACATFTPARQAASINAIKGYCRQVTTDQLIAELGV
jgi:ureidoacrylate peracid hydrolase